MIIKKLQDVPKEGTAAYKGVDKQIPIGPRDGSEEIVMRVFTVEPGGNTPFHNHSFPHLIKVEEGQAVAWDKNKNETPVQAGDYIYVPDNQTHGFYNNSNALFRFICIIPRRGEK